MLTLTALVCPQCAAPLPRSARWRTVQCPYCDATITRGEQVVQRADFHAAWLRARADAADGQVFDWQGARYRVLAPLGHGRDHEVLLARRLGAAPERVTVKLAHVAGHADALRQEFEVLRALQQLQGPGAAYFTRRLPQAIGVGAATTPAGGSHDALLLRHPPGHWGSLAAVAQAQPEGIDARHAVWLWRRMLEVLGFVHAHGWTHRALTPAHALVHPRDHGVLLIGWRDARHADGRALAEAVQRDLQHSAWTVRALLQGGRDGGAPGLGAHTPRPLADLLRACSEGGTSTDAAGLQAALTEAALAAFGAPRFVPFHPAPSGA